MQTKNRFRIIKETRDNGKVFFKIQKESRLFWGIIGPRIWKTYDDMEGGWHWYPQWGSVFCSFNDAEKELYDLEMSDWHATGREVVKEYDSRFAVEE